ncbi:DUF2079 domain-containing protein [Actinomyces radicidentis]|nr:DUF2079 domain-containing protein [Actinomyces radicidentis]
MSTSTAPSESGDPRATTTADTSGPDAAARASRDARRDRLTDLVPATTAVVVSALLLIAYSLGQWRSMYVPSWDLAIFSELAKDYAHLQAPVVPIKGVGFNLLGDHFHPILVLLGPVWALFPSPLSLLITQDLLLAVSAWPLTRVATRVVGRVPALALGLCYALSWGFQGAVAAQFHEIAFAVPMLAWSCAAFVERRWWASALWAAPLVLVKEDLGLTALMIGLAIAWRGRHEEAPVHEPTGRRLRDRAARLTPLQLGLGLAAFGLLMFLLTVLVILPLLSSTGTWQYGLGGNAGDGTATTASSDGPLSRLFSPEVKTATLAMIVCTAGLIGLGSPLIAAVLPTIAWRFLSSKEFYWDWKAWHYNAVLIPIALGALLDVLARLRARRAAPDDVDAPAGWLGAPVWARWLSVVGVAVPLVMTVLTAKDLPLASMKDEGWGATSSRAAAAQQVMDTIAEGATVETDLGLLAYLVPRAEVYWVGTAGVSPEYVVIDEQSSAWGGNPPMDAAQWISGQVTDGSTYTNVLTVDGYQVAKRNG